MIIIFLNNNLHSPFCCFFGVCYDQNTQTNTRTFVISYNSFSVLLEQRIDHHSPFKFDYFGGVSIHSFIFCQADNYNSLVSSLFCQPASQRMEFRISIIIIIIRQKGERERELIEYKKQKRRRVIRRKKVQPTNNQPANQL